MSARERGSADGYQYAPTPPTTLGPGYHPRPDHELFEHSEEHWADGTMLFKVHWRTCSCGWKCPHGSHVSVQAARDCASGHVDRSRSMAGLRTLTGRSKRGRRHA